MMAILPTVEPSGTSKVSTSVLCPSGTVSITAKNLKPPPSTVTVCVAGVVLSVLPVSSAKATVNELNSRQMARRTEKWFLIYACFFPPQIGISDRVKLNRFILAVDTLRQLYSIILPNRRKKVKALYRKTIENIRAF